MKKQTKILIGAVVVTVVIIIAFAINFPPVFKGKSSGTFGKASKYHKSQMTEKDVQLRSKLTADTVELKKTLQGLVYFTVFTKDLCVKIDNCVNVFQEQGLTGKDAGFTQLMLLKDYSAFIKNNNETLGNTIRLLKGFYFKEDVDQSADMEKTLRDFGNYVKTLGERDDVLESALKGMDNYLVSSGIMKERKEELKKLKSIRDQLLIQGIQLAGMVQDQALCTHLCSYALMSQSDIYKLFGAQDKLQSYAQDKLQIFARDKLQAISSQELNYLVAAQSPGLSGILYNRETLSFIGSSMADLNILLGKQDLSVIAAGIIGVVILAQDGLKLVMSNYDLQTGFTGIGLGAMNSVQLEFLLNSPENIGIYFATDFLHGILF